MAKGKKTGGRRPGSTNKVTKDVREAWLEAISIAQSKDGFSLAEWATRDAESNEKFWMATMKMVPREVKLDATVTIAEAIAAARARAKQRQ